MNKTILRVTSLIMAIVLTFGIFLPGQAESRTAATAAVVYGDSLAANWQDWSWDATRNFNNPSPIQSGSRSISVRINVAWGALYLHRSAPQSTAGYTQLEFYVHGGSTGSHRLSVKANQNTSTSYYFTTRANAWTRVAIPLSQFGSPGSLSDLFFQDAGGRGQSPFYLDSISLKGGGPAPTATRTPTPVMTATRTPTPPPGAMGPLRVSTVNPRYFARPNGTVVYLTGSHTWCNFTDCGETSTPAAFDYSGFLDFLVARNHNFFRLWRAENARGGEPSDNFWFTPMPYIRSGQCCAFDGGNKFDLSQFNQAYFNRLRQRVIEAGNRGIYVSIMLFDGWSVESKLPSHQPWRGHPYNLSNNINNINGDTNSDHQGSETHTLANPTITALQEAYVRKVIDTVNDLDNVLYEISNESRFDSVAWQYHMINYIKTYEASQAKQHPVGMTFLYPGGSNTDLFNSPADWVSPNGDINNPPVATGSKVILADTDHLCGICGNRQWTWKSFTRGENPIFMDPYGPESTGRGTPGGYDPNNPNDVSLRLNLGYIRSYAARMNLAAMTPTSNTSLCSTGYCLRNAVMSGAEYLAYLPSGGSITINLSATAGTLSVEWFNPTNGNTVAGGTVNGGANRQFTAPFGGDAVLYLKSTSP